MNENGSNEEKRKVTEVSGPFGLKIKFRGYDLVTIITIVALAFVVYILIDHKSLSSENQAKVVEKLTNQEEAMAAMIYILSLPQDKRDKLKLEMPDSLRKKMRDRDQ